MSSARVLSSFGRAFGTAFKCRKATDDCCSHISLALASNPAASLPAGKARLKSPVASCPNEALMRSIKLLTSAEGSRAGKAGWPEICSSTAEENALAAGPAVSQVTAVMSQSPSKPCRASVTELPATPVMLASSGCTAGSTASVQAWPAASERLPPMSPRTASRAEAMLSRSKPEPSATGPPLAEAMLLSVLRTPPPELAPEPSKGSALRACTTRFAALTTAERAPSMLMT